MRFSLFSHQDQSAPSGPSGLGAAAPPLEIRSSPAAGRRAGGRWSFAGDTALTELPAGLAAGSLDLSHCTSLSTLPDHLRLTWLNLSGCSALRRLPAGLRCYELDLRETAIRSLPPDLRVDYRIDLSGCTELESLPPGLKVGSLVLRDCTALRGLPEGLDVYFLDISGCLSLATWPRQASVRFGRLSAIGCSQLTHLPEWLTELSQLDVSGCRGLTRLPEGLTVSSWLELADSGLRSLPASLRGVPLRWRGVPIDVRIAFQPETITVGEVLSEPNVERRRVLLERVGYEAFLSRAGAEVLDRDRDPGGERRLLRVRLPGDEDLVCVSVLCPSTGRQYILRVPPSMKSCRQAAAWVAGFDDPGQYRPVMET
jgi:hypothetical protein